MFSHLEKRMTIGNCLAGFGSLVKLHSSLDVACSEMAITTDMYPKQLW